LANRAIRQVQRELALREQLVEPVQLDADDLAS